MTTLAEDRAKTFLQMIRRAQRGRLKIYLGYGPGVGKTYLMLQEGHRLRKEGVDAVVGIVETHGRVETAKLVEGLEVIPRRQVDYRGIVVEEMDLDAVLKRRPEVVLVDELAHTNVPGGRNSKRYEDVRELLAAEIHVIATLNVQHLESLYDTVERLIGVKVRERIPDSVVAEADQLVNVDLTPEDLQIRMREGKIYPTERIDSALGNFFKQGNLEHLRELTMREIASQIDFKRREVLDEGDKIAPDQVMVCLASKGPNSARLLRFASRLAGRFNRNWYAIYVQTAQEAPTIIDATTQRLLADTLTLANNLGATVFTFKGDDITDTILKFAKEYRVGHIVIGRPHFIPKWKRLFGSRSVAEELVNRGAGYTVVIVDADAKQQQQSVEDTTTTETSRKVSVTLPEPASHSFTDILTEKRIIIVTEPATKDEVIRRLVNLIVDDSKSPEKIDSRHIFEAIAVREAQGSTFLNESIAIPHARIPGLEKPEVALALTRSGISDVASDHPLEAVFLLLVPTEGPGANLMLLTKAIRVFQNLNVRRSLHGAEGPRDVLQILALNADA
jgi:two-component system sensor histidine kinase KdpD